ncbi:phosphotransferase [Candidatus Pacearchaeota archaeon]|nr:phosphotransferase [Candidatus Pacearchaeota archaeon]
MKQIENILVNMFHKKPAFLYTIPGFHRNFQSVYKLGRQQILVKEYNSKKDLKREVFFYEMFGKNKLIITPLFYGHEKNVGCFEFIESDSKGDLFVGIEDWARVHSCFLKSNELNNPIMANHKSKNLPEYVLNHEKEFPKISKQIAEVLQSESYQNFKTLIHGDLEKRNILIKNNKNCYIDFEFTGRGHPLRDLSLLLLNHPQDKEKIISMYRKKISFDYENIEKDTKKELFIKAVQLIAEMKNINLPSKRKKNIHTRFLKVMDSYL